MPWWVVAAGFAAAERWVVHLHFRRSTHSLSLGELPLVAGLMFLPAHELVLAGLVGSSLALAFDREIPAFKAFFNLAQFTLGTCVALFVVEGLTAVRDPLDPIVWVAVFAAVSAATLVADICVGRGRDDRRGQARAAAARRHAAHQLDRRAQQHLPRARRSPPSWRPSPRAASCWCRRPCC